MMRSAAYRIAILSSLAYAAATIALGVAVYWAARSGLQFQFDDRIASELHQLAGQYDREGVMELRGSIARREAAGVAVDLRYALYGPTGERLIGNYAGGRPQAGLHTLAVRDAEGKVDQVRVLAADLSNGDRLVVAVEWDALEENGQLILSLPDPGLIEGAIDQADELLALFAAILRPLEIESGRALGRPACRTDLMEVRPQGRHSV